MNAQGRQIDVVVIGRNEGERLRRCIASIFASQDVAPRIIYVDSGSTDGSVALAESMGVEVVPLDMSIPFTAARGRNAGLREARAPLVQFVDGDCELAPDWLSAGAAHLERDPSATVVFGGLQERAPEASFFNKLSQIEWDTLVGEAPYCGGIAMMRTQAVRDAGGFDASIMAGEEPELCERLKARGGRIVALDAPMATHDAAMHKLSQWWRRQLRAGYGMAQVAFRANRIGARVFDRPLLSAVMWGVAWPVLLILSGAAGFLWAPAWFVPAALLLGMGLIIARLARRGMKRGLSVTDALGYAALTMLSKSGVSLGAARWGMDRLRGRTVSAVTYKTSEAVTEPRDVSEPPVARRAS